MFDYSVTPVQQTLVCKIIHTECMYVQLSYVQSNCNRGWATVDSNALTEYTLCNLYNETRCIYIYI